MQTCSIDREISASTVRRKASYTIGLSDVVGTYHPDAEVTGQRLLLLVLSETQLHAVSVYEASSAGHLSAF